MRSLEFKKFIEFKKFYYSGPHRHQRLGQAFCDFFDLQKSNDLKDITDEIYELDGFNAIAAIHTHFEFN